MWAGDVNSGDSVKDLLPTGYGTWHVQKKRTSFHKYQKYSVMFIVDFEF